MAYRRVCLRGARETKRSPKSRLAINRPIRWRRDAARDPGPGRAGASGHAPDPGIPPALTTIDQHDVWRNFKNWST